MPTRIATLLALATLAASPQAHAGDDTILYSFLGGADGATPNAPLLAAGGLLYGTTYFGGAPYNLGTLFQLTLAGTESVLIRFPGGIDGSTPEGNLTNLAGTLYGVTQGSGNGGDTATAYGYVPGGSELPLNVYNSGTTKGITPTSGFVKLGGELYGVGYGGPASSGCIYKITAAGKHQLLATFPTNTYPNSLVAMNGTIYGTASVFGGATYGTIFSMDKTGQITTLHDFTGPDGDDPSGQLLPLNGLLYGTTSNGGTTNGGTFFTITPGGAFTLISSLSCTTGCNPSGALTPIAGKFYTISFQGGTHDDGTILEIRADGTSRIAHSFGHPADGIFPNAGLTAVGHTLYGTTLDGGTWNFGTVFSFTPGAGD